MSHGGRAQASGGCTLGRSNDVMCALANIGITRPSRWPLLLALASMMLVLNAVVVATIAAVTLARASRAGPALRSRRWNSASA